MALPSGMSACAMCVEINTGGTTTWSDVSDDVTVVTPGARTRMSGQAYTLGEDIALTSVGKLEPVEWTLRGIYTEGTATTDVWNSLYTAQSTTCGGLFAVRYAPKGCATTSQVFALPALTTEVISLTPPVGDGASPDILMYEAVVRANTFTWATYA